MGEVCNTVPVVVAVLDDVLLLLLLIFLCVNDVNDGEEDDGDSGDNDGEKRCWWCSMSNDVSRRCPKSKRTLLGSLPLLPLLLLLLL